MYDVMQGVRVIEVSEHTFIPAAGAILADWGADVIKVERTGPGDPMRNLKIPMAHDAKLNPYFEAANRGKRAIALDLTQEDGRKQLYKLIEGADVFLTNLRANARKKLGIEPGDLFKLKPKLIYARGTGYGLRGPLNLKGGFDFPTSWCRSGSAYVQTPPGGEPPQQPGSVGDLMGGATMAGAVAAALFRRERTGKGAIVDNALYLVGIWIMSQSLVMASLGMNKEYSGRADIHNPALNTYKTKDNRWIILCFLESKWWADFCKQIGREDLNTDPRYADETARVENRGSLTTELDRIFAARTFKDWIAVLDRIEGVWSPLFKPSEVIEDVQALENGFVTEVGLPDGSSYLGGASPAQFDERPIGRLKASPGYGQHTAEVLAEIGLDAASIETLKKRGVVH